MSTVDPSLSLLRLNEADNHNLLATFQKFPEETDVVQAILTYYSKLHQVVAKNTYEGILSESHYFLFSNCYTALGNGALTLFRGHLTHSLYYLRLISESIQNSVFLTHHPEHSENWLSERKKALERYKKSYGKWFAQSGSSLIKADYPFLIDCYNFGSEMIHSNFCGHGLRTRIKTKEQRTTFSIRLTENPSGNPGKIYMGMGILYHLRAQDCALRWWCTEAIAGAEAPTLLAELTHLRQEIQRMIAKWQITINSSEESSNEPRAKL